MTDWLKMYIGTLITDLSLHKQALEEKDAEIARLTAENEEKTRTISLMSLRIEELEPSDD